MAAAGWDCVKVYDELDAPTLVTVDRWSVSESLDAILAEPELRPLPRS